MNVADRKTETCLTSQQLRVVRERILRLRDADGQISEAQRLICLQFVMNPSQKIDSIRSVDLRCHSFQLFFEWKIGRIDKLEV